MASWGRIHRGEGYKIEIRRYLLVFLDLESGNDWWKEEDVHGSEMDQSNASKLLSKIEIIDSAKVIFTVCKHENVDEKMRK